MSQGNDTSERSILTKPSFFLFSPSLILPSLISEHHELPLTSIRIGLTASSEL